jgi:hypothetical protein
MESFPRDQQTPEALSAKQRADAAKWLPLMARAGKIKAYLVTSDTRLATAPDIPTADKGCR